MPDPTASLPDGSVPLAEAPASPEPGFLPYEPLPYDAAPASWPILEPAPESAFGTAPYGTATTTPEGAAASLSALVDELLAPAHERKELAERAGELVDGLLRLADSLLATAKAMGPKDAPSAALEGLAAEVLRLVDGLLGPEPGRDLAERVAGLVAGLLGLVDGLLGDDGTPSPAPEPPAPRAPAAPVPAPSSPTGVSSGASAAFGDGAASSALLLGVLASSLILLRGGKHSWPSRTFSRPASILRPAIERPG